MKTSRPEIATDHLARRRRSSALAKHPMRAATDALWSQQWGAMLDGSQVVELLGLKGQRTLASLTRRRHLLALPSSGGQLVYPAFQFGRDGRPYPALPAILAEFTKAMVQPYTLASWLKSPQRLLEGKSPAAWLEAGGDQALVIEAARRTAARLRR